MRLKLGLISDPISDLISSGNAFVRSTRALEPVRTVLLIGGGASHYQPDQRLWFAVGAIAASIVWFLGLSHGSALLAPVLKQARVLRGIDLFSGGLLWFMAFRLVSHDG